MIIAKETFNFIDKREGITKDGEKYLSINVLSKDNRKFNFITKDIDLINKISPLNLQRFAPIKIIVEFERVYNREKRTSYWSCEFKGVE
ncbi:MAG: hypothetical protein HFJ40_05475 [Clostridia bacterium]|nr:hypothetical protein [Clostridia bacterium]